MKKLIVLIIIFSTYKAAANESTQRLSALRFEIEEMAQKYQQEMKFRKESEEVLLNKINEAKLKILKEKIKNSELETELVSLRSSKDTDTKSIKIANLPSLHSRVQVDLLELSQKYPFSFDLSVRLKDLQNFYDKGQAEAYQVMLVQTLEKVLFDVSRSSISFETQFIEGSIKNVEVLRLGGWLALARLQEKIWIYSTLQRKWLVLPEGQTTEAQDFYQSYKNAGNNFVSDKIINLKQRFQ